MTDKTIKTLNELIETCKDGEYGFKACSEQAKSHELKSMLASRASECRMAAQQLQALVTRMGGKAEDDGSMLGAMHRGWVSVKAKLSSYDDLAVLEEAERGEDAALETYRDALKDDHLTPEARTLVDQQYQGVKRNHDEVRRRRDELKVKS
ncbi:PA2169 family four-helix-bundle protein [Piscinibacter sakaiensis]|uniref:PA2169 family four-helix-bundle protein n=1 Tax=Piscinibacter sakaiensis TaxID=1547922 RepID=UPI003AACD1B8